MKKIISGGILILLLVIGGATYNYYTHTPIYSLKQAWQGNICKRPNVNRKIYRLGQYC